MTQKATPPIGTKGNSFVRAIVDLFMLLILLIAAGLGGYFWGIHQQLAAAQYVPVASPAEVAAPGSPSTPEPVASKTENLPVKTEPAPAKTEAPAPKAESKPEEKPAAAAASKKHGKTKYWIYSSGTEYTGNSITVKVNEQPVDNFFGPGKTVDITKLVKKGENSIEFDSKALEAAYNKHKGDAKASLVLQVVSGPFMQENFKPSDVMVTYKRTAAENEDSTDSKTFVGE